MRKIVAVLLVLSVYVGSLGAATTTQGNVTAAEKTAVNHALEKLAKIAGRKLPVSDISPTPIPGLLQVTSDLSILYITTDGKYAMIGEMIDVNSGKKSWSLTEEANRKLRVKALAAVKTTDMIIFPSTASKKIGTVFVFTDIDCPYCHKMQEHIKEYTDEGIEVRYLSFPRSGPKTPSFDEAIKVWCAKDKQKAYTAAIETKEFPKDKCSKNPVTMEFELGQKMGITGTPTLILDNGAKVGGLVDPKTLAKMIKEHND